MLVIFQSDIENQYDYVHCEFVHQLLQNQEKTRAKRERDHHKQLIWCKTYSLLYKRDDLHTSERHVELDELHYILKPRRAFICCGEGKYVAIAQAYFTSKLRRSLAPTTNQFLSNVSDDRIKCGVSLCIAFNPQVLRNNWKLFSRKIAPSNWTIIADIFAIPNFQSNFRLSFSL